MRFNVIALGATAGLFWGAAILFVAIANMIWPAYGQMFLGVLASIYPGYHPTPTIGSVVTATLYGVVCASIAGAAFGWLYNLFSSFRR